MDKFYKIQKKDIFKILEDAKEKSFEIFLDELDCSKSYRRVKTDKTWEEIIEFYKESKFQFDVFIERNNKYIEVGVSCSRNHNIEYFIFINVDLKYLDYFIKTYGLKGY